MENEKAGLVYILSSIIKSDRNSSEEIFTFNKILPRSELGKVFQIVDCLDRRIKNIKNNEQEALEIYKEVYDKLKIKGSVQYIRTNISDISRKITGIYIEKLREDFKEDFYKFDNTIKEIIHTYLSKYLDKNVGEGYYELLYEIVYLQFKILYTYDPIFRNEIISRLSKEDWHKYKKGLYKKFKEIICKGKNL